MIFMVLNFFFVKVIEQFTADAFVNGIIALNKSLRYRSLMNV